MKTLILIRHAKSDWGHLGVRDYDRSLNQRGLRDAPEMGRRLLKRALIPDLFIASTAKRAALTAELMAEAMTYPIENLVWREQLYLASATVMMEEIRNTTNQVNCLALLAHNPGITELAEHLSGKYLGNVATAGVLTLTADIQHWHDVNSPWQLQDFDYPKRLPSNAC